MHQSKLIFQRPTFLHPESTPPKKPWIFIGEKFLMREPCLTKRVAKDLKYCSSQLPMQVLQVLGPTFMWIMLTSPAGRCSCFKPTEVWPLLAQVQLRGVKTWKLRSPPECWMSCHGEIQTTLYPGDIIIVNTNIWFHSTKVKHHQSKMIVELSVSLLRSMVQNWALAWSMSLIRDGNFCI